jgi:hypothetical protein
MIDMVITKRYGKNEGQITLVNLFAFFLTIFVWSQLAPMIEDATLPVITEFETSTNPVAPAIIVLINLISFVVLMAIIISIINQAIPQREAYR